MKAFKIILGALLVLISCNTHDEVSGIENPDPNNASHLKHFGFTLIDTYWDGPTDIEDKTNYSNEVAPFSNIADILVVSPTDDIRSRMQNMQQLQMKSMLHLAELFFEHEDTNTPSGNDYKLRAD